MLALPFFFFFTQSKSSCILHLKKAEAFYYIKKILL